VMLSLWFSTYQLVLRSFISDEKSHVTVAKRLNVSATTPKYWNAKVVLCSENDTRYPLLATTVRDRNMDTTLVGVALPKWMIAMVCKMH
jgi:hypothetical protein